MKIEILCVFRHNTVCVCVSVLSRISSASCCFSCSVGWSSITEGGQWKTISSAGDDQILGHDSDYMEPRYISFCKKMTFIHRKKLALWMFMS